MFFWTWFYRISDLDINSNKEGKNKKIRKRLIKQIEKKKRSNKTLSKKKQREKGNPEVSNIISSFINNLYSE